VLLKQHVKDYRTLIGWGQLFFLAGILLSRFLVPHVPEWTLWAGEPLSHVLQGAASGLATVLIGASIYMNVRGLVLYRKGRV
jgi:hypothetical protein